MGPLWQLLFWNVSSSKLYTLYGVYFSDIPVGYNENKNIVENKGSRESQEAIYFVSWEGNS